MDKLLSIRFFSLFIHLQLLIVFSYQEGCCCLLYACSHAVRGTTTRLFAHHWSHQQFTHTLVPRDKHVHIKPGALSHLLFTSILTILFSLRCQFVRLVYVSFCCLIFCCCFFLHLLYESYVLSPSFLFYISYLSSRIYPMHGNIHPVSHVSDGVDFGVTCTASVS